MTRRKVPQTCAVCPESTKARPHKWMCLHHEYWPDMKFIPCARGKLPVPPKRCPLRKEGTK